MFQRIEELLRARFIKLHGSGEDHQYDVYRCYTCGRLVTWNLIRANKVCCARKLVPTEPSFFEAVRLLVFPWSVR